MFRQYDLVIGVDLGITEACLAAKILKVPYGLLSYELYFGAETGPVFKESEIIACRDVSLPYARTKSDQHALLQKTVFLLIKF